MGASSGSAAQAVLLKHIAGNPPNADPCRSNETFPQYLNRMFAQGLNPDINSNESDIDYAARLASYQPAGVTASYASVAVSSSFASSASFDTTSSFSLRIAGGSVFGTVASSSYISASGVKGGISSTVNTLLTASLTFVNGILTGVA